MDTYMIKGSSVPGLHPARLLEAFTKVIGMHSRLRDRYYVSNSGKMVTMETARRLYEQIDPSDINTSVFSMFTLNETGTHKNQGVTYFPRTGDTSMVFKEDLLDSPDQLLNEWFSEIPFSNVVCSRMDYVLSFHDKWFKPPNSNVYQGPGLTNWRLGYTEGVSAEMWLGEPFWQHAKCSKADVLGQDWLHCEERPSHLYVRAWPEPFSSAEGEQGEIQRRLLDLLFGISANTPPPLPQTGQVTIVQKVLVDGDKVRDLGMEEIGSDGIRKPMSPPESCG